MIFRVINFIIKYGKKKSLIIIKKSCRNVKNLNQNKQEI